MSPFVKIVITVTAGIVVVLLGDRFIWPGTYFARAIGAAIAAVVVDLRRSSGPAPLDRPTQTPTPAVLPPGWV
ncbi:MAG: hypothetical protein AB7U66_04000 [Hyphomicrobiaceae bacterium]